MAAPDRRVPYRVRLTERSSFVMARGQSVATHDLGHLREVRRTTGRRVEHLGRLTKLLRSDRGRRDHAERLHVLLPLLSNR